MPRRTAQANKAIANAWEKEKQLILEGKGTRDWSPNQQKDIIERGKAYDEDGKAFQGHHMKSVEKNPDYQGIPENIQFLTKSEHLEAHNGNFQIPTNGYFNPSTKLTTYFNDEEIIPCKILKLKEPMYFKIEKNNIEIAIQEKHSSERTYDIENKRNLKNTIEKATIIDKPTRLDVLKNGIESMLNYVKENPGKVIAGIGAAITVAAKINNYLNKNSSEQEHSDNQLDSKYCEVQENDVFETVITAVEESIVRNSPQEHMVRGHKQRYNGVYKWKDPYPRGGNKEDS